MSDDPKATSSSVLHARINIHDEHNVRFWMKELGVDERTLKATVAAAGYSADAVRERLRRSAQTGNARKNPS